MVSDLEYERNQHHITIERSHEWEDKYHQVNLQVEVSHEYQTRVIVLEKEIYHYKDELYALEDKYRYLLVEHEKFPERLEHERREHHETKERYILI